MLSFTMHYNASNTLFTARVTTPVIPAVDATTDRTNAVDAIFKQFNLPDVYYCKAKLQVLLDSNEPQIHTNLVYSIKEAIGALNSILLFRKELTQQAMVTPTAEWGRVEVDDSVKLVNTPTTIGNPVMPDESVTLWKS